MSIPKQNKKRGKTFCTAKIRIKAKCKPLAKQSKVRKIDSFFKLEKLSIDELLSQSTAVNDLSFNQLATSERLRRAFEGDGHSFV